MANRLLMRHRFSVLVFLMAGFGPVSPTYGQESNLTVIQPHGDPVAGDHAEAVTNNPAGLAFGDSFQLSYTYARADKNRLGHGHSLLLSTPFGSHYTMGFGYERLELPGHQEALPTRMSWAHALRFGSAVSLGLTWHNLSGATLGVLDDVDLVTVGLQLRPWRWLALGVVAENLNRPKVAGIELERAWTMGLAVRPGTEQAEVSGYMRLREDDDAKTFGARLRTTVLGPLSMTARYETAESENGRTHQIIAGLSTRFGLESGAYYLGQDLGSDGSTSGMAINFRTARPGEKKLLPTSRVILAHVPIENTSEYMVTGLFSLRAHAPFLRLLQTLRGLERSDRISGVVLDFRTRGIGWAQADELWQAIERLKTAGKTVYTWMPAGDTRSYAAASGSNRIYTTPAGGLLLTGVLGRTDHFGQLLSMIGVKAEFVATGEYKTFPELFTRREPSKESSEVQNSLVDALYGDVVAKIAKGRNKTAKDISKLIDDGPYTAERAKQAGLVDKVLHYDEFEKLMQREYGSNSRLVPASSVLLKPARRWGVPKKIAVLYITGTITDGPSSHHPLFGAGSSGSSTLVKTIEAYRRNNRIKAVVVRVDSPGGSVTASDAIWRALTLLNKEKPVIVSMGDIAASGGYYVAAPATQIFASDMTITGSIGVFAGKFSLEGLMKRFGVYQAQYPRGKHSALLTATRPWSESERAAMRRSMDALYDIFLQRVASGRKALTKDQVRKIAQGRVWTGRQAKKRNLVDDSKGLLASIDAAAAAAKIDTDDAVVFVGPAASSKVQLPSLPFGLMGQSDLPTLITPARIPPALKGLSEISKAAVLQFVSGTPLAILPFTIE